MAASGVRCRSAKEGPNAPMLASRLLGTKATGPREARYQLARNSLGYAISPVTPNRSRSSALRTATLNLSLARMELPCAEPAQLESKFELLHIMPWLAPGGFGGMRLDSILLLTAVSCLETA